MFDLKKLNFSWFLFCSGESLVPKSADKVAEAAPGNPAAAPGRPQTTTATNANNSRGGGGGRKF